MVPQLRQPNPKSHSVPPSLNSNNVYQHRTPNTLTRFSTLYATFPRHHSRLNTKHSDHTLKSRSSRRFSSLWEVQLELGEIPGMLSPNILEPYQPMSQALPLSPHNSTNSTRLFIERTIANGGNNESYSSFSSYVFSDIDVREDEGDEESQVEEDEEEEKRVEGEEEMEGEEEEEEEEEEQEGGGDEPFGDFYYPDGIYSYTSPLHPSDSASSLLLPGPLPWATIVDTPEEMEDEATPYSSTSSSTLSKSSSSSSMSSSAEIILVKYETRETILEDEEGEDEMDTDGLEPSSVTAPARATALSVHPLDGPYATQSAPALEEDDHQDDDSKNQEQTQVVSFSYAPASSSSIAKSTRPAPTLLFSSVHSEMRQDRKDSGVFIMHDDGLFKMEAENGPLPPLRPASVLANHDVKSVFHSSPEGSESASVMDQGDATPPPPPSRLHMYSSLMMSSSLISLSA
ncbi:hypothetical protein BGZ82_010522 [Podila clonocystis]|nr:hypothetical protein BGZ82_010522 [Podila clonocystis]